MDMFVVLIVGTIAAAVILGVLIGKISARSESDARVEQAFQKGREEADVEKANIALEIGQQLIKMRESIKQAAEAYESTVMVVRDRLAGSVELLSADDRGQRLLEPADVQLSVNLEHRPDENVTSASKAVDSDTADKDTARRPQLASTDDSIQPAASDDMSDSSAQSADGSEQRTESTGRERTAPASSEAVKHPLDADVVQEEAH
jgi:hypothetical protein